ncbi:UNVERIFIED_CONTAM: hypothetical protein FKN15_018060 [Acipenser sinensis]
MLSLPARPEGASGAEIKTAGEPGSRSGSCSATGEKSPAAEAPNSDSGVETPALGFSLERWSPYSRRRWSTGPSRSSTLLRYPLTQTHKKTLQRSWV